jgi:hypothetical protein
MIDIAFKQELKEQEKWVYYYFKNVMAEKIVF